MEGGYALIYTDRLITTPLFSSCVRHEFWNIAAGHFDVVRREYINVRIFATYFLCD